MQQNTYSIIRYLNYFFQKINFPLTLNSKRAWIIIKIHADSNEQQIFPYKSQRTREWTKWPSHGPEVNQKRLWIFHYTRKETKEKNCRIVARDNYRIVGWTEGGRSARQRLDDFQRKRKIKKEPLPDFIYIIYLYLRPIYLGYLVTQRDVKRCDMEL